MGTRLFAIALALLVSSPSWAEIPKISCSDAIVLGRVIAEPYTELPQKPGTINMDVQWALRVKVIRVIEGRVPDQTITVNVIANGYPRMDKDLRFQLKAISPGRYRWMNSEADCEP